MHGYNTCSIICDCTSLQHSYLHLLISIIFFIIICFYILLKYDNIFCNAPHILQCPTYFITPHLTLHISNSNILSILKHKNTHIYRRINISTNTKLLLSLIPDFLANILTNTRNLFNVYILFFLKLKISVK